MLLTHFGNYYDIESRKYKHASYLGQFGLNLNFIFS